MSGTLLFSPMTIRGVELKNRIVVPPMHQYSAVKEGGVRVVVVG
jgi:2,4-dienoyl-CoA reductase-like NADH-dependent reductase (Old Yellow Enzyme family)